MVMSERPLDPKRKKEADKLLDNPKTVKKASKYFNKEKDTMYKWRERGLPDYVENSSKLKKFEASEKKASSSKKK